MPLYIHYSASAGFRPRRLLPPLVLSRRLLGGALCRCWFARLLPFSARFADDLARLVVASGVRRAWCCLGLGCSAAASDFAAAGRMRARLGCGGCRGAVLTSAGLLRACGAALRVWAALARWRGLLTCCGCRGRCLCRSLRQDVRGGWLCLSRCGGLIGSAAASVASGALPLLAVLGSGSAVACGRSLRLLSVRSASGAVAAGFGSPCCRC